MKTINSQTQICILFALDEYIKMLKAPFRIKLAEEAMTEIEKYTIGYSQSYVMPDEVRDTIRNAINYWKKKPSSIDFKDNLEKALKIIK